MERCMKSKNGEMDEEEEGEVDEEQEWGSG